MNNDLERIKIASQGLLYMSESDYPFELVHIVGESHISSELLIKLSGKPSESSIEKISLEYFFRNMVKVYPEYSEDQKKNVDRFKYLQNVLNDTLSGIVVYRIGNNPIDVFIMGKMKDGNYGGLRTIVIET